jgi:hypothetical protein
VCQEEECNAGKLAVLMVNNNYPVIYATQWDVQNEEVKKVIFTIYDGSVAHG